MRDQDHSLLRDPLMLATLVIIIIFAVAGLLNGNGGPTR